MQKGDRGELWIGIIKLVKAVFFIALGVAAISMVHKDVQEIVGYRIAQMGFDPDNRFVQRLLEFTGMATPQKVQLFSIASFLYGGLFGTEGIGLILHKRWALYFTVIITASFLPLEVYELTEDFTWFRLGVLIVNVFFLVYLYIRIKKSRKKH
jgi:uncharacterized membrane protein (DUF2068 family)